MNLRRPLVALALLASCKQSPPPAPAPVAAAPDGADITFNSTPSGATVIVDGRPLPGVTPLTVHMQSGQGDHHARFEHDGFIPSEPDAFLVPLTPYTVVATLKAAPHVRITTDPAGGAITIDGKKVIASTPGEIPLLPGPHEILAERGGCVPVKLKLDAKPLDYINVKMSPAAILNVTASMPGAHIFVDDQDTGQVTPFAALPVVANQVHRVSAKLDALRSRPVAVKKLKPGKTQAVSLKLEDLTHADLVAHRKELQGKLARLQSQAKQLEKATSKFMVTDAKAEHADEERLDQLNQEIEQLSGELEDVNEQLGL